jgi:hypothetical protein
MVNKENASKKSSAEGRPFEDSACRTLCMFHVRPLYFRESSVNGVGNTGSADCGCEALRNELLVALEKARGCLAVAIAEESKSTLGDRRRHYLKTADHVQRFIAVLRNGSGDGLAGRENWVSALEALRHLTVGDGAQRICACLQGIVTDLNAGGA